jgi:hypothetical protein
MNVATIDPATAISINHIGDAPTSDHVLWKRRDEERFHEGRIIDTPDGTLAFLTVYADRPDRTDLIDLVIPTSTSVPTRQRMIVSRVDGHDDQHCLVALAGT